MLQIQLKRNEPLITRTAFNRHDAMSVEHLFSIKVCIHIFHADVKVKIAKNTNLNSFINSFKEPSPAVVVPSHL